MSFENLYILCRLILIIAAWWREVCYQNNSSTWGYLEQVSLLYSGYPQWTIIRLLGIVIAACVRVFISKPWTVRKNKLGSKGWKRRMMRNESKVKKERVIGRRILWVDEGTNNKRVSSLLLIFSFYIPSKRRPLKIRATGTPLSTLRRSSGCTRHWFLVAVKNVSADAWFFHPVEF